VRGSIFFKLLGIYVICARNHFNRSLIDGATNSKTNV